MRAVLQFCFLCVLLSSVCAHGQQLAYIGEQRWSTEEGLPQQSVHQVFQSRGGYLWIATERGVARFDGVSFKTYSHETSPAFSSDDVSSIAEDGAGDLWFATSDGLVRKHGPTLSRLSSEEGLPSNAVTSVVGTRDGELLVLVQGALFRFDGASFRSMPSAERVTGLQTGAQGTVWIIAGAEVFRYERGGMERVDSTHSGSEPLVGFQTGPRAAPWFATAREVKLAEGPVQREWSVPKDFAGSRIATLFVDREGTAWIGTNRGLFTVSDEPGARVQTVEGLRSDSILSIFEDREGNHWVGTEESGLVALRPRKFRADPDSVGEPVTAVVQASDGAIWFGTREDGVRRVAAGTAVGAMTSALTSPVVLSLAPGPDGDVWVGTPDGLNHVEQGLVHKYTSAEGLPDDFVRSVLVSKDGSVWVGTRYGLARMQGERITVYTRAEGLASDSIGSLYEGRAGENATDLWIATSAGLSRFSNGAMRSYGAKQGMQGSIVTAITQDGAGALWVGVHGAGLHRFDGERFQQVRAAGMPTEISGISVDASGYMWLRAARGVYRVAAKQLKACAEKGVCSLNVSRYGLADGMPSDEATSEGWPSMCQAKDGELWFTTRKGIAVTDPAHLAIDRTPPPIVVQGFSVDGVEEPLERDGTRIGPGHRSYTFDYAGLSYTMPSRVRYRYQLEGFDRDWVDAGNRRTAYYTSVPARHYRFRVIAQNGDGVWSERAAELSFSVLPPFYLRWWFYLLMLVALAGIVMLILQMRVRSVRRQFALVLNERNRLAREVHDTLAQDLVSVSLQLEIASELMKAQQVTKASEQIQATRALVKKGLEAARQSIWNLRANTSAESLPSRLSVAVQAFAATHPGTRIKIGGAYRPLARETEDEVLRIAGEALSNVKRHAAATEVDVQLQYERDKLLLTVADNGRGFEYKDAVMMDGHYGLRGMQERADALGASLLVESERGKGTTVRVDVPLDEQEAM